MLFILALVRTLGHVYVQGHTCGEVMSPRPSENPQIHRLSQRPKWLDLGLNSKQIINLNISNFLWLNAYIQGCTVHLEEIRIIIANIGYNDSYSCAESFCLPCMSESR